MFDRRCAECLWFDRNFRARGACGFFGLSGAKDVADGDCCLRWESADMNLRRKIRVELPGEIQAFLYPQNNRNAVMRPCGKESVMTITLDGLLKDGRYQKLSTVSKALLPILLANLQEEGDRYELDREELAEQSGLADVAVRRALTELQNEGIIEQRKMVALTLGNGKPLPEGQKVRNKTSKTGKRLGRPPKGA